MPRLRPGAARGGALAAAGGIRAIVAQADRAGWHGVAANSHMGRYWTGSTIYRCQRAECTIRLQGTSESCESFGEPWRGRRATGENGRGRNHCGDRRLYPMRAGDPSTIRDRLADEGRRQDDIRGRFRKGEQGCNLCLPTASGWRRILSPGRFRSLNSRWQRPVNRGRSSFLMPMARLAISPAPRPEMACRVFPAIAIRSRPWTSPICTS